MGNARCSGVTLGRLHFLSTVNYHRFGLKLLVAEADLLNGFFCREPTTPLLLQLIIRRQKKIIKIRAKLMWR